MLKAEPKSDKVGRPELKSESESVSVSVWVSKLKLELELELELEFEFEFELEFEIVQKRPMFCHSHLLGDHFRSITLPDNCQSSGCVIENLQDQYKTNISQILSPEDDGELSQLLN